MDGKLRILCNVYKTKGTDSETDHYIFCGMYIDGTLHILGNEHRGQTVRHIN